MAVIGTVVLLTGSAIIVDAAGSQRPLALGDNIQPGDTIIAPKGVLVELQLANGNNVQIAAEQTVTFTQELSEAILDNLVEPTDNAVTQATIQSLIQAIGSNQSIDDIIAQLADARTEGFLTDTQGHTFVDLLRLDDVLNQFEYKYDVASRQFGDNNPLDQDRDVSQGDGISANVYLPRIDQDLNKFNFDYKTERPAFESRANNQIREANDPDYVIPTVAPVAPPMITPPPPPFTVTVIAQGDANKTSAEATATAGVITVKSEAGNTSVITFAGVNGTVTITIINDGSNKPVVLSAANLVTLGDGPVEVTTVTTSTTGAVITTPDIADGDFVLDTLAPSPPVGALTHDAANDTGSSVNDSITKNNSPEISGTGTAGDTITLYAPNGTTVLGTAIVGAGGTWIINPTTPYLTEGLNNLIIKETDPAGNVSAPVTVPVTLDSIAPVPTITVNNVTADNILNAAEASGNVTITGVVGGEFKPNDSVTLVVNGHTYTGTVDGAGNYSILVLGSDLVVDTTIDASVTTIDVAGNLGNASTTHTHSIDTTSPSITINTIAGDDIINALEDNSPVTISGVTANVENGQVVTVVINGVTYNAIVTANAWTLSMPALDAQALAATENVTADVSNFAGNAATQATHTVNHDAIPPSFGTQSFPYAENQVAGAPIASVVATDNVAVTGYQFSATGTNLSDDTFYQISSTGIITITAAGTAAACTVNDFETGASAHIYAITVIDSAGNSTIANVTLNETNVNEAPTANPDTGAVAEDATLTVLAVNGVIQGTGADTDPDAGDILSVFGAVAGAGAVTQGAGVATILAGIYGDLTLNANGSYTYNANNANTLAAGVTATDTFTYIVKDAAGLISNTATLTITVTGTNDVPIMSADTGLVTEDVALTVNGTLSITDADAGQAFFQPQTSVTTPHGTFSVDNLGAWTYTVNNSQPAVQALGVGETLTDTITVLSLDGTPTSVTITINGSNDAPTANTDIASTPFNTALNGISVLGNDTDPDTNDTLTVTTATLADNTQGSVSIVGNKLNFNPSATAAGPVVINYTISDGHGGTSTSTLTVNVGINTPPDSVDVSKTIFEDNSYTFVSTDFAFNDTDLPAQSLNAVRIDAVPLPLNGTLTLNGGTVSNGDTIALADIIAGNLVFTPAGDAYGAPLASFTFSVQDSFGTYDTTPNTITFNVTAVNDAPAGTNATLTTLEDTARSFSAADFGFTDPNDSPANSFQAVSITTLPASGSLTLSGVPVTAGQSISFANIANLVYTPAANANGAGLASFTFQVQDSGGVANGGQDTDQSPNTITFNVTAVNDAPVNSFPGTQTTLEDMSKVFSVGNGNAITVSDVDSATLTTTITITNGTFTALAFTGATITNNNTGVVTISGTAAAINGALNGASYVSTPDFNGVTGNVNVSTSDGVAPATVSNIAVTVNADPDIVADAFSTTRGTAISFNPITGTNGASADNFEGATPQITQIAGSSISVGGSVAVTNGSVSLAAGNVLTFTPTGGFSGNVPAFSYTVSSGGVTETANITVRVIGVSSITSPTVVETDAPGVIAAHVVTLTGATTSIITMPFTIAGVSATAGSDYNATPTFTNGVTLSGGILTIPLGVTTFTINVPITGDTTFEPTETYNVVLDNVTSVGTITDNDTSPTVAVGAGSGTEGGNIVHTVTLSNLSSTPTNYTYLLAGNTATTAVDYNPTPTFSNGVTLSGTTLTVPAGVLSFTVSYATIQDTLYEGNETYDLTIGGVAAVGTITDDEIKPSIAVSNVTVSEVAGSYAIFTVTLSGASAATVNAALTLSNGTAVGGTTNNATNDFKNDVIEVSFDNGASWTATTTAAFASGATSALVRVLIYENTTGDAASENFNLIATPSAGQTSNASATGVGTILETNLTISNNNANEGTAVVHTVTMAAAFSTTVSTNVFFNIVGAGTNIATSGTDFNPVPTFSNGVTLSGNTLTIPANVTTFTVTVPTFTDTIVEPSETYQITIAGATGVGTINDLSAAPSIASVSTATATEGTALVHTVTITGTSTVATTYAYALNGVTATAGTDYNTTTTFSNGVTRAGATLTVPAGVTSFTVTVPTFQDTIDEPNETYTLTVGGVGTANNGTILDDDATPTLTVGNVSVLENAGFAVFTVSLSNPSSVAITGNLGLTAGTATTPSDYTNTMAISTDGGTTYGGTVTAFTIAAGATSILVRVPIINTAGAEPVETFTLNASAITNTSNATATGTGTIIDTTSPTLSINDITVNEAAGTATFTVTLSATSSQTITVDYNTTSTTAQVGADFTNTTGTLTFAPGALTQTITVPIINDNLYEVTETFKVNLVNPINASISDNLGVGTITDNDTPTFSVSNVSVSDQTNGFAQFIVSLSNPSSVGTVFSLALASSGASPATGLGVDYGAVGATNIQVSNDNGVTWTNATAATIAANSTYVLVRTPITQDALTETSETFTLTATLTAGTATGATTATTAVGTGTITDVNNAPDAVNDVPISNIQEDTVNTTVAGNAILGGSGNVADSDPNNDTLSITGAVAGTNAVVGAVTISGPLTVSGIYGNLIINANGSYTYTLDNSRIQTQNMLGGQSYNDVFTYKITDGNGGYDTATISVAVLGTLDLTAIVPQPVAVFADGLIGEYYGYNDTVTAGNRVHSDDTLATKVGTTSNLDSVEDIAFIIDGRNALMGGGSIVGTNKAGATNAADVIFNVRTLNYGLVPLVTSSLGSNASTAGGSALPAQDNNSNSTTTALANFLDQDSSTATVQTGTPTAGVVVGINTGLGRTTDGLVRMSGNAYLERGNYDFRVIADDGFRLKVGGKTLLEFDGNQAPTVRIFKNVEVNDLISGLTSVELLYWEQGGNANLTFDFKLSSSATWVPFSLDSIAFFSVPNTPTLTDTRLQDIVETSVNQQYELRTGSALDGDGNTNTLTGQIGRDYIQGLGGDDVLYGYNPADLANITKDGADFLSGGAGNDTLDSGYGNDILDGGTGADDMTGGMGDDIYYIDNAGDVIHENANEGTDTVEIDAAYSPPGAIYTIPTNIENVLLKGSLNTGVIGNAADNRITGNDGNNALDGGAGDDRLIGGKGNDTLTGGTGNDIFEWGLADKGTPGAPHIDTITDFTYVNGAYGTSAVILTNGTSKNFQDATNLHGDSIDLRDLLIGEQSTEVVTNGTPQIGNLLQFLDFAVTGAGATLQTTLHISSDALTSGYGFNGSNATGTNFVAGHEDQTIIFKGVDLYAATGVAAGNETLLLQALLKNGTLVVD